MLGLDRASTDGLLWPTHDERPRRAFGPVGLPRAIPCCPPDVGPLMAWRAAPGGAITHVARRLLQITGTDLSAWLGAKWLDLVHCEDRQAVLDRWAQVLNGQRDLDLEFRLCLPSGATRWVRWISPRSGRASDRGELQGYVEDIQARRDAAAARELMLMEVEHRGRNLLAVLDSLIQLSPQEDMASFVATLRGRVRAIANAHALLGRDSSSAVSIERLLASELGPYEGRVEVSCPHLELSEDRARPLAMVFHELATNSAKHGALSAPEGRLTVRGHLEGERLVLEWRELGGPPVRQPARAGFGLTLLQSSLCSSKGDALTLDWRPAGLSCTLKLSCGPEARGGSGA